MSAPEMVVGPRRRRPWGVVVMIFLLGLGVGSALSTVAGLGLVRRALKALPEDRPGWAERTARRVVGDVQAELDLGAAETAAVRAILLDSAARLRSIRLEAVVELEAELQRSTAAVAEVLPEEKRAAWYTLVSWRFERLGLDAPSPAKTPAKTPADQVP